MYEMNVQELSSKFELFQQPADYDGRLGRISRQLRDIQHNMYLTELVNHEPDSIHGQLHHTRCIYNVSNNNDTLCPGSSDPPEKCLIYLHQKMRLTPFFNYYDSLG